jgi:hypothetical protein
MTIKTLCGTYVDTVLTSPRNQVLEVRHDHSDEVALQTVTVHVALQHVRALAVNCLQELSATWRSKQGAKDRRAVVLTRRIHLERA